MLLGRVMPVMYRISIVSPDFNQISQNDKDMSGDTTF